MSKDYTSGSALKQFFENIATAKVAESGEYLLGTKDGKIFRVAPIEVEEMTAAEVDEAWDNVFGG